MKQENYILWLPSWYPNQFEPYNGDFIQRHARATARFIPVTVFHFVQAGSLQTITHQREVVQQNQNLLELTFYPKHAPIANAFFNKWMYNARFYKQAKKRLEQHFREYGLPQGVHVHVPVKAGNLALWIKTKWGIPFIASEQSSHYLPASPDAFFKRSIFYRWQVRRIFQQAKTVTNVSKKIGLKIQQLFNLREVHTIHNLVETNLFTYKPLNQDLFTFIHVSGLNEQKNINGILLAFVELAQKRADWKLNLVGPCNESLIQKVQSLGLADRVILTGEIPYEQVADQMQKAHAFVLFSRHENFPCVVVEALCCGLPVVAADVAGVGEAVTTNNGILVEEGDEIALATALERIMKDYIRFDRSRIAADASALYSAEKIGAQIFNLYQSNFNVGQ